MSANQQDYRLDDSEESESENMTMVKERILLAQEQAQMLEILGKQAKEVKQLYLTGSLTADKQLLNFLGLLT